MTEFAVKGGMDRTSALVAPLTIRKKPSNAWSAASRTGSAPSSPKSRHTVSSSRTRTQLSPPQSPRDSQDEAPEPESFPNYLRAFYHFHPSTTMSSAGEQSSVTVAINQGDVILVHSIHPNGWADGTLLNSGERGWLPTNYCEKYNHPFIASLLFALTHLWDLVSSGETGNVAAFSKQDYVRSMIAGVRMLLEKCNCLTRESQLVTTYSSIRRLRKSLLGDLSSLVKTAKQLQQSVLQGDLGSDEVYQLLDELVFKAFKVVTRAVRFLDVWSQDSESEQAVGGASRPMTPPHEAVQTSVESQSADVGATETLSNAPVVSPPSPPPSATLPRHDEVDWNNSTPRTVTYVPYRESLQSPSCISPKSMHPKRISVSHRASYTSQVSGQRKRNLASERLSAAQDLFLGSIGSFIGLHLQSRSSSELLSTTQQAALACRQLLAIVDGVWERDYRRSEPLAEARNTMHEKLSELVQTTKDTFAQTEALVNAGEYVPGGEKEMVSAATGCVKAAGDCVAKAKVVIERIGDFEFEENEVRISDAIFDRLGLQRVASGESTQSQSSSKPLPDTPAQAIRKSQEAIRKSQETKPLPPPPAPQESRSLAEYADAAPQSSRVPSARSSKDSLPKLPIPNFSHHQISSADKSPSLHSAHSRLGNRGPTDSVHATDSTSTYPNSVHGDGASIISHTSTRATTPDDGPSSPRPERGLNISIPSVSELQLSGEECSGVEEEMLVKTYVHELIWKDGQIAGGSLPALVEQLTNHESTPDSMFVTVFYLTFRLFTTPVELAQHLIDRFTYVGESKELAVPVRLRVYNIFKGWLESHWQPETDQEALGLVLGFATGKLRKAMPSSGKRLADLVQRVSGVRLGASASRLVSSQGKTNTSVTVYSAADPNIPNPVVSKSQLNALKAARNGTASPGILDFDPLELARQFTLIESKLFCAIQPHELLASEWTKKDGRAINVRAMSKLSTDLANLVADNILQMEEPKKRAAVIKQWVKIAGKCLELNNYDSLMAIICSLNSSMVMRLKRTWEMVSTKTHTRLEELREIVNVGRNYAVLRKRLENHVAPCIPFVGIYLTDLTFVDVGNHGTRQLPGEGGSDSGISVINFDKHMRTAKIISQLQRFQVPYALAPVLEMQDWIQSQIERVRSSDQSNVQNYYRRSLMLEPREAQQATAGASKHSPNVDNGDSKFSPATSAGSGSTREKFDFLNAFSFATKEWRSESVSGASQRSTL
ncbi:ras guanine-nucleotide exchange protein Cdc25p [Phyllosticta capitalensis]|uniref:Ras guanine-nucleotide exchange protein Cdc25p n=2 Tax=Phyllosticta capitalensis TaxID=121624 RepID=A0ABR1Z1A7_9PEZI